jgi:hypothetical protein
MLHLQTSYRARIFEHLWSPGIDSKESIPPAYVAWRAGTINLFYLVPSPHRLFKNSSSAPYDYEKAWDGIFEQSMGARNQVGIGLSYRPARLHRLAEFIPWNRFLGSIQVLKYRLWLVNIFLIRSWRNGAECLLYIICTRI